MTSKLQKAMARYEAARVAYRLAVLGSFGGPPRGEAIRAAIRECQDARTELQRLAAPPARPRVSA